MHLPLFLTAWRPKLVSSRSVCVWTFFPSARDSVTWSSSIDVFMTRSPQDWVCTGCVERHVSCSESAQRETYAQGMQSAGRLQLRRLRKSFANPKHVNEPKTQQRVQERINDELRTERAGPYWTSHVYCWQQAPWHTYQFSKISWSKWREGFLKKISLHTNIIFDVMSIHINIFEIKLKNLLNSLSSWTAFQKFLHPH